MLLARYTPLSCGGDVIYIYYETSPPFLSKMESTNPCGGDVIYIYYETLPLIRIRVNKLIV
jgi:hypothetical protein